MKHSPYLSDKECRARLGLLETKLHDQTMKLRSEAYRIRCAGNLAEDERRAQATEDLARMAQQDCEAVRRAIEKLDAAIAAEAME